MAKRKTKYGTRTVTKGRKRITRTHTDKCQLTLVTERKRGLVARSGCGNIKIGKEWWKIVVVAYPLTGVWGYYDAMLRLIVIDGTGDDTCFLDTIIHEASHGLDTSRPEPVILKQGNALADLLTAFGYKN